MALTTLSCTKDLLKTLPCLQCESESEILAYKVYAWAVANGIDVSTQSGLASLRKSAACLECMSDKQLEQGFATVFINRFDTAMFTRDQRRAKVNGIVNSPQKAKKAMLLYLMCSYFAAH